jgi:hypothetical protein
MGLPSALPSDMRKPRSVGSNARRVQRGGMKERRLADTGNAMDDGDERHVALDELE